MGLLDDIVADKQREVKANRCLQSLQDLEEKPLFRGKVRSLKKALISSSRPGIIAEIKRSSPSGGTFDKDLDPAVLALGYQRAGAVGVSVLTDQRYFRGTTADLVAAKDACVLPLLRKDFIVDEYQLVEARAYGADAILLIARVLEPSQCCFLATAAKQLGLEVLLEIHDIHELDGAALDQIDILGINNRDLDSLTTDYKRSLEIAGLLPKEICRISESGISSAAAIRELHSVGYCGFLIGEAFMRSSVPEDACRSLISSLGGQQ